MKNLHRHKFLFFLNSIFIIMDAAMSIVIAFLLKEIVDIAVEKDLEKIMQVALFSLVLIIVLVVVGVVEQYVQGNYIKKIYSEYKDFIIDKLLRKDLNTFRTSNTGNYISVINNDIKVIETDYTVNSFALIKQFSLLVMGIAAMISISIWIFLTAVIASLLPVIVSLLFKKQCVTLQEAISEKNKSYTNTIKDLFNGFLVIKSYNIEDRMINNVAETNHKLEDIKKKFSVVSGVLLTLNSASGFIVVIACFSVGTILCSKNIISAGAIVAVIQLLNYFLGPVQQISLLLNKRSAAKQLIYNIDKLVADEVVEKTEFYEREQLSDSIKFEDVSFAYDDRDVLNHINIEFKKGKKYAIVGLSGSGKSTLINLLMGYYDNFRGNITYDGMSINNIARDSLYRIVTMIQQDVFIFDDSIENNLTLYSDYSKAELDKAIAGAELLTVIANDGIEFKCGENGNQLSGGEKQRISIGRALLRNSSIMIMDEATSALDTQTAFAIENTLLNLEDTTGIVITHKLNQNILERYDEIIVMDKGTIVESGTFESLMSKQGIFYSMYNVSNLA